jgi:hypothetical protein
MTILRKTESDFQIYENTDLGILVAIKTSDNSTIKAFWKANKGKSIPANDTISGHPFVFDEEQGSLKIDFSQVNTYEIKYLQKYL